MSYDQLLDRSSTVGELLKLRGLGESVDATQEFSVATDLRSVLGHFPTGVAVISGRDADGEPRGLTVQSFMALSMDPPMILLSVGRSSTSWPRVAARRKFAVNVLANGQQDVAVGFARSGGTKFAGVDWQPGEHTQAPLISGCQAWIECEIWQIYDGGDHEIVAAHILGLVAAQDPASHALLFYRSKFPQVDRTHWDTTCS